MRAFLFFTLIPIMFLKIAFWFPNKAEACSPISCHRILNITNAGESIWLRPSFINGAVDYTLHDSEGNFVNASYVIHQDLFLIELIPEVQTQEGETYFVKVPHELSECGDEARTTGYPLSVGPSSGVFENPFVNASVIITTKRFDPQVDPVNSCGPFDAQDEFLFEFQQFNGPFIVYITDLEFNRLYSNNSSSGFFESSNSVDENLQFALEDDTTLVEDRCFRVFARSKLDSKSEFTNTFCTGDLEPPSLEPNPAQRPEPVPTIDPTPCRLDLCESGEPGSNCQQSFFLLEGLFVILVAHWFGTKRFKHQ